MPGFDQDVPSSQYDIYTRKVQYNVVLESPSNLVNKEGIGSLILNHSHRSRAETTRLIATWISQDRQGMIESFTTEIEAVEKCVRSFRACTNMTKNQAVNTWVDNERKADEDWLDSLHKTYMKVLLQKPEPQSPGIRDFSFNRSTDRGCAEG
jgi:hypothetical protein